LAATQQRGSKKAKAVQAQQAKVAESVSKGPGKRLEQRQRTLAGLAQERQAVQHHHAPLASQATALGPPRERADRDFRKQTIMTMRPLLWENALTSFMAVLLGLLTRQMSLDCLLKILFERSGARVVTDSQVIYWVNTAGLSGPYHRRLVEIVAGLCAMDLRYQGKPIQVRLKATPPWPGSVHGQIACPFFGKAVGSPSNIQRRLFDYQFSLTQTPAELEQVHQRFIQTYNTTAHEGLVKEGFAPPIPMQVLAEAKGRLYSPDELARKFSRALFPRTTNRYGCVTLHSYHFYIEEGVPHTQVLLWVYGEQLRAVLDHVVLAEYHCRYDWRTHKVTEIREGIFYPTRFASLQGSLIPLTPQESLVLYRPQPLRRPARLAFSAQQLMLFALVPTG
jgi:hypothetical protein